MDQQHKFNSRDQFNLYRKQLMGEERPLPNRHTQQAQQEVEDEDQAGSQQDERYNEDWQQFGELVQTLDPATLPVYYFYVNVTGQILYGEFQNYDRVKCKFAFVSGDDWYTAKGALNGECGYARRRQDNKCIWDLEFQVQFRSTYPYGWPQLVMQFQGSSLGKFGIISYACGHVPTHTQMQQKRFRVFQPALSKKDQNMNHNNKQQAWFDPKVIASAQGREVTSVQARGTVTVLFQVVTRNMESFGYKLD